jgi:nucleoside-diphosphate-sugar epimerase
MAFHKFMRAMAEGRRISLYGDGGQTRDFTYIDDIVSGILAAPAAPSGSVINLGGGQRVTLRHALDVLRDVTGIEPLIDEQGTQAGDVRDTWADLERARTLLGYAPQVGLAEGLAAEWTWLRGGGAGQ